MPYKSDAQRRFFHSPGALKAGITPEQVEEYDGDSAGKDLPPRAAKKPYTKMVKNRITVRRALK